MLLGNTQLRLITALLWSKMDSSAPLTVCWVVLISLFSHINTACSHAALLSPIINRFLNKDVCLDLKNPSKYVVRVSLCLQGDSLLVHLSVFRKRFFQFAAKHF